MFFSILTTIIIIVPMSKLLQSSRIMLNKVLSSEFYIVYKIYTYMTKYMQSFNDYTQEEQFIYVMSNPACYKIISKAMYFILSKKHQMFYR